MDSPPHVSQDIIHCNDLDTLLVGIVAKVRFGSRVVYDAHEFYPESHVGGRWLDTRLLTALERFLIRKADAVVTVNPMLAEVMRRVYGLAHVYSVPNAEWWIEPGDRSPFRSRMTSAARGRVKVLFQGRFADGRGIEELLEGWTQVDGDRAALFLRGPDNTSRRSAIEQARTLALLDRSVFFLDPVPEDMLVSAAAEADIGVIPYRPLIRNDQFSCPNKLSQYLHAGLMVVTNDLPYVKSVILDAGAGLLVHCLRPYQPGCCDQSDRRRPPAARQVPAKRVAIRQAIVQLAMLTLRHWKVCTGTLRRRWSAA